jgi:hypothetical protein
LREKVGRKRGVVCEEETDAGKRIREKGKLGILKTMAQREQNELLLRFLSSQA